MIHCNRCQHYYVTWDKDFPHGCRAMKFKSHQLPSAVVYESSGKACLAFSEKNKNVRQRLKDPKKSRFV